ncbi:MAG: hypothetical protein MR529_01635 [Cuneatibacter sp.]|nr:hypothetical protein [Cuneatibacter sp.]
MKGSQWEVACDCWFTADGDLLPRYIKVKDEDGEIRTIKQLQIHSQERKNYAGIPSIEFDCTIIILGRQFSAKLIYYMSEGRWVLNFK